MFELPSGLSALLNDLAWLWGVVRCQCQTELIQNPEYFELWPSWSWASSQASLSNQCSPWFYRAYWRGIYGE